jgi:uracil-DNA glycosylase
MEWLGHLYKSIELLDKAIVKCQKCPRLVEWREEVAVTKRKSYENEKYWGKPVPGFGSTHPKMLIVGLAPGAHGANRLAIRITAPNRHCKDSYINITR